MSYWEGSNYQAKREDQGKKMFDDYPESVKKLAEKYECAGHSRDSIAKEIIEATTPPQPAEGNNLDPELKKSYDEQIKTCKEIIAKCEEKLSTPPQPVRGEEDETESWQSKCLRMQEVIDQLKSANVSLERKFDQKCKKLAALKSSSFSASDMEGFVEWIIIKQYIVTDYRSKKIGPTWSQKKNKAPLTTSELLTEYLNSPEYKNK